MWLPPVGYLAMVFLLAAQAVSKVGITSILLKKLKELGFWDSFMESVDSDIRLPKRRVVSGSKWARRRPSVVRMAAALSDWWAVRRMFGLIIQCSLSKGNCCGIWFIAES